MNIWHDTNPNKISPKEFMAVVEIPSGSKKKYELDKETGVLRLDRILYTSTHYPANYGFIPRTYADDGDPLDVLILCTESLDPMIMVNCYPIGVVRMLDSGKMDDKIIAIPLEDPTWNYYKDISTLPPHILNEIVHFFEVYKNLEKLDTAASEILGCEGAMQIIKEAMNVYEKHFCGKMS